MGFVVPGCYIATAKDKRMVSILSKKFTEQKGAINDLNYNLKGLILFLALFTISFPAGSLSKIFSIQISYFR